MNIWDANDVHVIVYIAGNNVLKTPTSLWLDEKKAAPPRLPISESVVASSLASRPDRSPRCSRRNRSLKNSRIDVIWQPLEVLGSWIANNHPISIPTHFDTSKDELNFNSSAVRWEDPNKTRHILCSLQQKCRSPTTSETKLSCWWCRMSVKQWIIALPLCPTSHHQTCFLTSLFTWCYHLCSTLEFLQAVLQYGTYQCSSFT